MAAIRALKGGRPVRSELSNHHDEHQANIDRIPNRSSMLVFAPPAAIKHSFSASNSFDARLRYSAKRFPFFGLEPTGSRYLAYLA